MRGFPVRRMRRVLCWGSQLDTLISTSRLVWRFVSRQMVLANQWHDNISHKIPMVFLSCAVAEDLFRTESEQIVQDGCPRKSVSLHWKWQFGGVWTFEWTGKNLFLPAQISAGLWQNQLLGTRLMREPNFTEVFPLDFLRMRAQVRPGMLLKKPTSLWKLQPKQVIPKRTTSCEGFLFSTNPSSKHQANSSSQIFLQLLDRCCWWRNWEWCNRVRAGRQWRSIVRGVCAGCEGGKRFWVSGLYWSRCVRFLLGRSHKLHYVVILSLFLSALIISATHSLTRSGCGKLQRKMHLNLQWWRWRGHGDFESEYDEPAGWRRSRTFWLVTCSCQNYCEMSFGQFDFPPLGFSSFWKTHFRPRSCPGSGPNNEMTRGDHVTISFHVVSAFTCFTTRFFYDQSDSTNVVQHWASLLTPETAHNGAHPSNLFLFGWKWQNIICRSKWGENKGEKEKGKIFGEEEENEDG